MTVPDTDGMSRCRQATASRLSQEYMSLLMMSGGPNILGESVFGLRIVFVWMSLAQLC